MDRARIEEEFKSFPGWGWKTQDQKWITEFAEYIAKLAREEAIEQAAKVCDNVENDARLRINDYGKAGTAWICAAQIRKLKEQK